MSETQVAKIEDWKVNPRWQGVERPYTPQDVERLSGSLRIEYTLARRGAERLWELLQTEDYVAALGAMTGNQAIQMVQAGLKALYISGWQVAGDANEAGEVYPDQSLYPANSVPSLVRRINKPLRRRHRRRHLPRPLLRPLGRHALVRDRAPGPRGGAALRRGHPRPISRQAPGLQLLAVVQLEAAAGCHDHRPLPARAGRHGLQVQVRHPGRLPSADPE